MWGYHLTIDCAGCNRNITDAGKLAEFAADLVDALKMKAFGAPLIQRFGEDPKVAGYTLVQLIETSDITGHFCDHTGEAYIDIFSCKAFAESDALEVIDRYFAPLARNTNYTVRQAPVVAAQDKVA